MRTVHSGHGRWAWGVPVKVRLTPAGNKGRGGGECGGTRKYTKESRAVSTLHIDVNGFLQASIFDHLFRF